MSQVPLNVAILWHMHQPDYFDPVSGETLMPWTWLHAVKDYGEMLRTLAEVPGATATFNLVPTLIEQMQRYADGTANDRWLRLAETTPEELTPAERHEVVDQFFSVHRDRHIQPYPRYRELAERRHSGAEAFSDQDLRDLQVWFLLSWTGYTLRRDNPLLSQLMERQRLFSEDDKQQLLDLCKNEVAGVLELYRQLEQEGRIEISLTPYTHPILPLLIDSDVAHQASTGEPLPDPAFSFPEDARLQVQRATELANAALGERPRGMWPAEGSVSEAALRLLAEARVCWAASDEGILQKSIEQGLTDRRQLYRPWSFEGLPIVFRDRELSDRIGFLYADWDPERAVQDLIGRLEGVARTAPGGLITLILDGENCWERYRDNGYPFLTALYHRLNDSPLLNPVTVGQGIASTRPQPLKRLRPGSWINANFGIWIGHPEENTAWQLLQIARKDLASALAEKTSEAREIHTALLRAEGSDWFWWYGDDHSTAQAALFDLLFRRHLQAAYRQAGLDEPQALHRPIKQVQAQQRIHPPFGPVRCTIDGKVSSFLEWRGAGHAPLIGSGAMHSEQLGWKELFFGTDGNLFFLRLVPCNESDLTQLLQQELSLRIGEEGQFQIFCRPGEETAHWTDSNGTPHPTECAAGDCLELALPVEALRKYALKERQEMVLSVHSSQNGQETGRWPAEGPVRLPWSPAAPYWLA